MMRGLKVPFRPLSASNKLVCTTFRPTASAALLSVVDVHTKSLLSCLDIMNRTNVD